MQHSDTPDGRLLCMLAFDHDLGERAHDDAGASFLVLASRLGTKRIASHDDRCGVR